MYFQDVIMNLHRFWADQGCIVYQPYDNEVLIKGIKMAGGIS